MFMQKFFPEISDQDSKKVFRLFRRSALLNMSWEQMTGQARGTFYAIHPFLEEIYKDRPEELEAAYARHLKYFNTSNNLSGFILGLLLAMEEKKGAGEEVTGDMISGIRIALCGPFAGIGDTFFQGILKILIASFTMGLAATGNVLGPILFMLIFGGILWFVWLYGSFLGYSAGTKFLDTIFAGGLIDSLTKAAGILGLAMIGAMTATNVTFAFNWQISTLDVQTAIDNIFPGLLSLAMTFGIFRLIKKKVNIMWIVYGIMAICMVLAAIGIV